MAASNECPDKPLGAAASRRIGRLERLAMPLDAVQCDAMLVNDSSKVRWRQEAG